MRSGTFGALVVLATALMGSSFAVGKLGLEYVSPLLLVGIRFTLAGVLMALSIGRRNLPATGRAWARIAVIGFFQTAGVMGCIFLSMRTIPAGETSILTFVNPLLVVIWGTLFLGLRYRTAQWLGVVTGLLGVAITLGFHLQFKSGTLLGLGAAVSWSVATILVKQWGGQFNTWVLSAYQMLSGGLIVLAASFVLERPRLELTAASTGIIVWLAVMSSIVQFATWYYLLHHSDPGRTSAFLFLAPFFGVLSGWLLLGEVVRWYVYAGGLLIFLGIFLVNWTPARIRPVAGRA